MNLLVNEPPRRPGQPLCHVPLKTGGAAAINHGAALGIGGVVLFGPASPNLARTLTEARAVAPRDNAPLIASDGEGVRSNDWAP
jgi:hypothetical protein